jgi:parallel beta-helix repeat protein
VVSTCDEANLLAALVGGGAVTFSTGDCIITVSATILISTPTTIDGAGQRVTLSGGDAQRIITTTTGVGVLTLRNITLMLGRETDYRGGGAIYVLGDLVLSNTTFLSNTASGSGGGAYVSGAATLRGGLFQNNTSTGYRSYGGGLYASTLVLTDTQFLANTAYGGGGAYVSGAATLRGGLFQNNTSTGYYGGGLYASTLVLTDTQFLTNTAYGGGGAYVSGAATLNGGLFQNNAGSYGGGLYASTLVLTDTQFLTNTAYFGGGGAYVWGAATLRGGLFQNNTSTGYYGGGLYASTLVLTDTQFLTNTAYFGGGGAYVSGAATLRGGLFQNNTSTGYGSYGGGLSASTLVLTDTQFLTNTAYYGGGGAYVSGAATLNGGLFQNNAGSYGGGLSASPLVLTGTQFLGNRANQGGGVYLSGASRVVNTLFARNTAPTGAALYFSSYYYYGSKTSQVLHTTIASPTLVNGSAIYAGSDYGGIAITNTIIASHTTGIEGVGGTVFEDYNLFANNTFNLTGTVTSGGNSFTDNPAFVAPLADNYHLGAGSCAIDSGVNANVFTDFENDSRPQGTGFDIGYDESPLTNPWLCSLIASSDSPTVLGNATSFTTFARGGGSITYMWDFGDNSPTASGTTVTHTYATVGIYTALVTATNGAYTLTATTPVTVGLALCFATPDDGVTLFQSVDADAVQQAADAAMVGAVIKVAGTCTGAQRRAATMQTVYISQALTLRGGYTTTNWTTSYPLTQATTLDALGTGRVVFISSTVGALEDLKIQNGNVSGFGYTCSSAGCGGGIFATNALTLTNVHVLSNTASYSGGGAYVSGAATLNGGVFQNNTSTGYYGGGLYASTLVLTDTQFLTNTAYYGGGGAYVSGAATLRGGLFQNNISTYSGGGGLSASTLVLTATQFLTNTAYYGGGGASVWGAATLNGGLFQNNISTYSGGGGLSASTLVLTDTQFLTNTAYYGGGGAYVSGAATLNGGVFQNNTSTGYYGGGGGLYASTLVLTDTQFLANTAYGGGGAYVSGAATLNGGLFQNNTSTGYYGGGGGLSASTLVLTATQFLTNTATAYYGGGGAYVSGAATLRGGLFQNNTSTGYGSYGGGLSASTLVLTDTQFLTNTAYYGGGGAYVSGAATLNGGVFQNNTSTGYYGGSGGGLSANVLMLTGTQFLANRANQGGGLSLSNAGRVVNALFARNTAPTGAAAYFATSSSGNIQVLHTTIASPTLANGSAIFVLTGTVGITNTIITSHTSGISRTNGVVFENYNLFFGNSVATVGGVTSGEGSLIQNPDFTDPTLDDYHLAAHSCAIDLGSAIGVNRDFENDVRPQGSGFDMGFDESPIGSTRLCGLNFASNPVTPTVGVPAFFVATQTPGAGITYTWSINGVVVGNSRTLSYTFMQSGVYTATLVATNGTNTLTVTKQVAALWRSYLPLIQKPVPYIAGIRYVAPGGNCGGPPLCYATVQEAVDASKDGDEIRVASGTYRGVQSRDGAAAVVHVTKTVTIRGGYTTTNWVTADPLANLTTLDAQSSGSVIVIRGNISTTIEGLRVTRSSYNYFGSIRGGIYALSATVTLNNNTILNNNDGGVYLRRGAAHLSGNTISNNWASCGGGVYLSASLATLISNTINNNSAHYGAVCVSGGTVTLSRNTIRNNYGFGVHLIASNDSLLDGNTISSNSLNGVDIDDSVVTLNNNLIANNGWGGVYTLYSYITLNGNTIRNNNGRGIYAHHGTATLISNTLYLNRGWGIYLYALDDALVQGNTVTSNGRGIFQSRRNATLIGNTLNNNWNWGIAYSVLLSSTNTTLINNVIKENLGEIRVNNASLIHTTIADNDRGVVVSGRTTFTNTILVNQTIGISVTLGSTTTLNGVLWFGNGVNITGTGTSIVTNEFNGDPVFAPDRYHLNTGSAAIDRGVVTAVVADIDGQARLYGAAPDLGADELHYTLDRKVYLPLVFR